VSTGARVLLVEDDRFVRTACEAVLRACGFDVVIAADGEEGLRQASRAPHPDLIVLDLLMPRLGGMDVLRHLKATPDTAAIPVVILTSTIQDEDRARALELGAVACLGKADLSLKELATVVERIIRGGADSH
jgi:CheY-like chemotaxis protein